MGWREKNKFAQIFEHPQPLDQSNQQIKHQRGKELPGDQHFSPAFWTDCITLSLPPMENWSVQLSYLVATLVAFSKNFKPHQAYSQSQNEIKLYIEKRNYGTIQIPEN